MNSLTRNAIALVATAVAVSSQACDYCPPIPAGGALQYPPLSPECIAANPIVGDIIARDSSCGRAWDAFCILEYNDCYNQACGPTQQALVDSIAAVGGPGGRPLNRTQIQAECPPTDRPTVPPTLPPSPSTTECPEGKGKGKGYSGYQGKKGGKNGGYYGFSGYSGKKGGYYGFSGYSGKKGGVVVVQEDETTVVVGTVTQEKVVVTGTGRKLPVTDTVVVETAYSGKKGTKSPSGYSGYSGKKGTKSPSGYSGYSGKKGGISLEAQGVCVCDKYGYTGKGNSGYSGKKAGRRLPEVVVVETEETDVTVVKVGKANAGFQYYGGKKGYYDGGYQGKKGSVGGLQTYYGGKKGGKKGYYGGSEACECECGKKGYIMYDGGYQGKKGSVGGLQTYYGKKGGKKGYYGGAVVVVGEETVTTEVIVKGVAQPLP